MCGCILGWQSVMYQFLGHCHLDLVSRITVAYLPYFFAPTLNIKMVLEKKYLKWDLFQILSLFSLLNVITKFNNFPTLNFVGMQQEPHIYFI